MITGIDSLKDLIEVIAAVVTSISAISLVIGLSALYTSRDQLKLSVMTNCISRYQQIYPSLDSPITADRERAAEQYIDLCNEELFYFKNKFVPREVVEEWMEGMLNYVPVWVNDQRMGGRADLITSDMLDGYPRIRYVFQLRGLSSKYGSLTELEKKKTVIRLLIKNLKKYMC